MYYVETETLDHKITSSYDTEKRARQYGGEPYASELHLYVHDPENTDEDLVDFIDNYDPKVFREFDVEDMGRVRTIYESKYPIREGKFDLWIQNGNRWEPSGISFVTYSDANQAIKGPLAKMYNSMLIVERDSAHTGERRIPRVLKPGESFFNTDE